MQVLDEKQTREALPFDELISAIERMFASDCVTPLRHHHEMEVPGEADATMLLMPCWLPGQYSGVKFLNLFPDNHLRSLPTIIGRYLLSSGKTGEILALIEGGELTARRTAATSALASRYLSREDSRDLVMVGTGRLSLNLMEAHYRVRPIERVRIWGRDLRKSSLLAEEAIKLGIPAEAAPSLEDAARQADIISCATLSNEPLIRGEWLKPGCHVDLVGAFKPTMRESDDTAIQRSSVFVDTYEGATHEGGDIAIPLKTGVLKLEDIRGDMRELVTGKRPGRTSQAEITLFKSVGAALEDLAGAILAYETTLRATDSR
ncbi:ornithine cyclodeaminase family protein [Rhizobium rhizoryzae]|uniref:Ornithine cyclodeaminase n=1 Tax=Rhizobium rhizoryzae TaxID=451876 RepID=A0A7W6PSD2_9HYPH|nr:ornithine cyclodeaminase family protein [Rhizobium rhizoryzae]MBB4145453.1 ornithine cyclodeaminase [Rhizobium rhizoryzae]